MTKLQHSFTAGQSLLRSKEQTAQEPDLQKYLHQVKYLSPFRTLFQFFPCFWFSTGNHIAMLEEYFIKISGSHGLCICFSFTSRVSFEIHTQNASASAKALCPRATGEPTQSALILLHYRRVVPFLWWGNRHEYSARKLGRELKDCVHQQRADDL